MPRAIVDIQKPFTYTNVVNIVYAPTDADYIVTAADGTLTNEIVIPGMAGSGDIAGIGGTSFSEEYDTASSGLTWDIAPATEDSNTTRKSHLYVTTTTTSTRFGLRSWSPAGAFDARTKVSIGATVTGTGGIGLVVGNSDNTSHTLVQITLNAAGTFPIVAAYTFTASTYTQRGSNWSIRSTVIYLRITRDGSNNVKFFLSNDGYAWQIIATQAFTFTAAQIGYRLFVPEANGYQFYSDYLRGS